MAVSSLGVGSGLDLNNLLTSLMQAEQQPLVALQRKEASFQSRISALGSLKGSLSSLQTAAQGFIPTTGQTALNKYASFSATVADNTIASALAFAADSARELNVMVAAGATLENVRDAINTAATDGRISATIVNGTNGKQLVLSSTKTGTENVMKLSGIGGLDFNPAGAGTGTVPGDSQRRPGRVECGLQTERYCCHQQHQYGYRCAGWGNPDTEQDQCWHPDQPDCHQGQHNFVDHSRQQLRQDL